MSTETGPQPIVLSKEAHEQYLTMKAKLDTTTRTLRQIRQSIDLAVREHQRVDITAKVLTELDDDVPLYKNYGKMYMMEPRPRILAKAEQALGEYAKEQSGLKDRYSQISARGDELQKAITDFVAEHGQSPE